MRGGERKRYIAKRLHYNGGVYNGGYMAEKDTFTDPRPDTKPEQFGEITWENGASYRGEWKNGLKHGMGEMRRSDGIIFKGEWKNDEPTGQFTVTEPNVAQSKTINAEEVEDYGSPGSPPFG